MEHTALIAMSGGVDSSVAAFLTLQQGYACMGATMRLFNNEHIGLSPLKTCCSLDDIEDARRVAEALGMGHRVFNLSEDFNKQVMRRFADAYLAGSTPNPCIDCNRYLKFERLLQRAGEMGYEKVVTGHYAQIRQDADTGRFLLYRAADKTKDQSYVLYTMTQAQLAHTLFPLGGLRKAEVREIAQQQGFVNAKKRESQDICFVPDGDYAAFIQQYTGHKEPPGLFVDGQGGVLGRHAGVSRYTIGQRRGIGLSFGEPMYVTELCTSRNTVTLGRDEQLYASLLFANELNWIAFDKPKGPLRVMAKIRYRHSAQAATLYCVDEDTIRLAFDAPQRAITPGQAVVFYSGDRVVGGGRIMGAEEQAAIDGKQA